MRNLRQTIRRYINESVEGLGYQELKIQNELGRAIILYGDNGLNDISKEMGYDNYLDVDDITDKQYIDSRYNHEKNNKVQLIDWRSTQPKNGFGRYVINQIIDLVKKLGIDEFQVKLPSKNAQEILNHYVNKGLLKPIGNPLGVSTHPYHTKFKINNL